MVAALVLSSGSLNLSGTAADPQVAEATEEPVAPTPVPTDVPAEEPTDVPAEEPTDVPAEEPTDVPAEEPTDVPLEQPTDVPTEEPTDAPTDVPPEPTDAPTDVPPEQPTQQPTSDRGGGDIGIAVDPNDSDDGAFGVQATYQCQLSITDAGDDNPFTFDFAAINANNIASYSWDLGDGSTPSGANVSHTYTTTGTFNITLTCTTTAGADIVLTGSVGVYSSPLASFSVAPGTSIISDSPVSVDISMLNNSSGGAITYAWSITGPSYSDSSTAAEPTFTLTGYGTYTVQLTVTDGAGQTSVATQTVEVIAPAPSADFTVDPSSGELDGLGNFTTTFTGIDNNTGPIDTWTWDFGDGVQTATGQGPHVISYTTTGTYSVTMAYSGPGGSGTVTRQVGVYPPTDPVTASFNLVSTSSVGASGVRACFENTSTGPVATNTWTFPDTPPVTLVDNNALVCFDFSAEGNYNITLQVADLAGTATSSETQLHGLWRSPIADFTETLTTVTWGGTIDFTDLSTGIIQTWSWDFDGDGIEDSDLEDPSNIQFSNLGANPVRLTVTGPGGIAFVEHIIIVQRLEITCSISGSTSELPGTTNVPYTSTIGNLGGRGITYQWYINGVDAGTSQNINVDWNTLGSNFVEFTATTDDGSTCTDTLNVQVEYQPLTCSMSQTGNLIPDGNNIVFQADVGALQGRTLDPFVWYVDGVVQAETSNQLTLSYTGPATPDIRYTVATSDGTDDCDETRSYTIAWPTVTCPTAATLGPTSGIPNNTNYTWTVNFDSNELIGRTLSAFSWTEDLGSGAAGIGETGNSVTRSYNNNEGAFTYAYSVDIMDGGTVTQNCTGTVTINVAWPTVTCPTGAAIGTPNMYPDGSNNTWTVNLNGTQLAGRTTSNFTWEIDSGSGAVVQGETGNTITRSWTEEGTHTIDYSVDIMFGGVVTQTCTGTIADNTVNWPNLTCNISGDFTVRPTMPDATVTENYNATTGNQLNRTLTYSWTYTLPDGSTANSTASSITGMEWQWDQVGTFPMSYTVTATNPNNVTETEDCTASGNIVVSLNPLTCNALVGDINPVLGETANYTTNVNNHYGRDITYNFELLIWDGGAYVPMTPVVTSTQVVTGGGNATFTYQFNDPGEMYRLTYVADTINPVENCNGGGGADLDISSAAAGVGFSCDAGPVGNFAPTNRSSTYTYDVTIDNTNGYNLQYDWVLVDESGTRQVLATSTSTTDGVVTSPAISGDFGFDLVGNYTLYVEVQEVGQTNTAHTCTQAGGNALNASMVIGLLNVDYTFTVNNNAVEEQSQFCLTNASTPTHGSLSDYTWNWDFGTAANSTGSQTFTGETPPCFSFDGPGTYTVELEGSNGTHTESQSYVFQVYGIQSITIDRAGGDLGPANITFTANGQNLTGTYNWVITNTNTNAVINGADAIFTDFLLAGPYTAVVSNTGPLGTTTAQIQFELIGASDIRAAFTPTTFGGQSPLDVCFIDQSIGNTITDWTWDFGNGQTLTYNTSNVPGQICTTYVTTATQYLVTLSVTNGSITRQATNVVRTYNTTESNASFSVTPQGNGVYCFSSILTGGVTVTDWDFGDGTTAGAQDQVCHTYGGSGSFQVEMGVTDGSTPGTIVRLITVTTDSSFTPPSIVASGSCNANSVATFTIQNTGGDMATPDRVTITDNGGNVILVDEQLQLANGASTTYTVSFYAGTITLSTLDTGASASTNCNEPPQLSVVATCQSDGVAVFTITNTSTDTDANQTFEVRDSGNALVSSGSISVPANGGSTAVNVSSSFDALTFTSSGAQGPTTNITASTDCVQPPVLTGTATCQADGTAVFTITNNSAESNANQAYTIVDGSGTTVDSGTLTTAMSGGTTTLTVPNNYTSVTFSTDGGALGATTVLSLNTDCDEPPVLVGTTQCQPDGTTDFTITNNSTESAANQPYTIVDGSGATVESGTLTTAANGGTTVFNVPNNYTNITFSTDGGAQGPTTVVNINDDCDEPPVLSGVTSCAVNGNTVFTITNASTESDSNQPYEIRDVNGTLVDSGTLVVLMNGGTTDIEITGVYTELTFTSDGGPQGPTTVLNLVQDCDEPPILSGGSSCDVAGAVTYTIINSSTETASDQPYQVLSGGAVIDSGNLNIPIGGQTTVTVTQFGPLTFTTSGLQGITTELDINSDCVPETGLGADGICYAGASAEFVVTNYLGDRDISQDYSIFDTTGAMLDMGNFTIAPGTSETFTVTGAQGTVSFVSAGTFNVVSNAVCSNAPIVPSTSVPPTPVPSSGSTSYFPPIDMTPARLIQVSHGITNGKALALAKQFVKIGSCITPSKQVTGKSSASAIYQTATSLIQTYHWVKATTLSIWHQPAHQMQNGLHSPVSVMATGNSISPM